MPSKHKKKSLGVRLFHWLPLLLILLGMLFVYVTGIYHYFSFHMLKEKHDLWKRFVHEHPVLAPTLYAAVFITAVAISLPVGDLLGVLGGFLFPFPWNLCLVVISATMGSCFLFLATRSAVRDFFRKRAAPFLKKMAKGFQKDAWSYLLFLRFIPLFPFWLVNIVPAFFNVSFTTFLWTTFLGVIPLSYLHIEIGEGLDTVFEKGEKFSIEGLFNPQMRIALVLLGLFALLPLLIKKRGKEKWK